MRHRKPALLSRMFINPGQISAGLLIYLLLVVSLFSGDITWAAIFISAAAAYIVSTSFILSKHGVKEGGRSAFFIAAPMLLFVILGGVGFIAYGNPMTFLASLVSQDPLY